MPAKAWESYKGAIFRFRPPQTGYQQLFLDGRPAVQVAVGQSADGPPELKPRQWCLLGGYIYFCVEQTKLPADYRLTYAREQTGHHAVPRRSRDHRRSHRAGLSGGRDQSVQHAPGTCRWSDVTLPRQRPQRRGRGRGVVGGDRRLAAWATTARPNC